MNYFAVAIQIKRLWQNFCVLQLLFSPDLKKKEFLWSFTLATVSIKMFNSEQFTSSLSNFRKRKVTYRMQIKKLNNIVSNLSHFL